MPGETRPLITTPRSGPERRAELTRRVQLRNQLRPFGRQTDLLLAYVLTRLVELEALEGHTHA